MDKLTQERKIEIAKRLAQTINEELSFHKMIAKGATRTKANIRQLDLESPSLVDTAPADLIPELQASKVALVGSLSANHKDLDYFLIVGTGERIGCHSFSKSIGESFFPELLRHLVIRGLEGHDLIHTVLTPDVCDMEEGVAVLAYGAGCKVEFFDNGLYRVGVREPDEMYGLVDGAVTELASSAAKLFAGKVGMSEAEPCNCEFCEARRAGKFNPDEEKPSTTH